LHNVPVSVREGKFVVEGQSSDPVIVDIFLPDKNRIATVVARDGEKVKLKLSTKPYSFSAKGDEISEQLSEWVKDNASVLAGGDAAAINGVVEKYIKGNRDNLLSTVLLLSYYNSSIDPLAGTQLFDMIEAEARPSYMVEGYSEMLGRMKAGIESLVVTPIAYYVARDSADVFEPGKNRYTLLALTSTLHGRDTIVGKLARMVDNDSVKVLELSVDNDSTVWRRSIAPDSAAWAQGWLPGGVMTAGLEQLAIPRLPYFVIVDSVGNQLLRSSSLTAVSTRVSEIEGE
ncbi:MAG: hypothetical protein K2L93_04775, partial [Muribaculaceae bacterium]|nr:hypothetical protein [Muribaculaceae bacterium]